MYPNAAPIKQQENSREKLYKSIPLDPKTHEQMKKHNPQKYGWNKSPKNEGNLWVVAMVRIF